MRLKNFAPYLAALAVFALTAAVYFAPQFGGRELPMHDVTQYLGMSQDIREHRAAFGEDPQWEGRMFSGMPSYQINFDSGGGIIQQINGVLRFMGDPAALIFIAMAAFWLMLLLWGVNPWIGVVPAVAYGLSTYTILIVGAGHISKVVAMAYAPAMIGAVYYALRRNAWVGGALTALFGAIELAANHPQITYYFLIVTAALWINELVRAVRRRALPWFAKATATLVVAGALAVGANVSSLWYTSQSSQSSTRGGSELKQSAERPRGNGLDIGYATDWSYGRAESFNLYVADFMGGDSGRGFSQEGAVAGALAKYNARSLAAQLPAYWGEQPYTAGPTYIGAVILMLAAIGLFLLKGRHKWWIVAVSLLALLLSWGHNLMWFTEFAFRWLPGYNKFRAVSTTLVIVQWAVPMVAALMLGGLWKDRYTRAEVARAAKRALYVLGGLALFFALFGGMLFDFVSPLDGTLILQGIPDDVLAAMRDERASIMRLDALRSLVFVALAAGAVMLCGRMKKGWFVVLLLGLTVADLMTVDMRFLPHERFVEARQNAIQPTAADRAILADTTPGFRVANLAVSTFNDATTSYFHRSIGGYHGAKMQRYQEIIDRYLARRQQEPTAEYLLRARPAFNMLNTRYFIIPDSTSRPTAQQGTGAFGAAWFVEGVVEAEDADRALTMLGEVDLRNMAVVEKRDMPQGLMATTARKDTVGTIRMAEYRVNYQRYTYTSCQPDVAVFSEIYYPHGWSCTVDGQPVEYFCADYVLRAMVLPQGSHTVEFRFAAPHYALLAGLNRGITVAIILLAAAAVAFTIIKRRRDGSGE
ncbi:MAG: hypothetical protein LBH06_02160 [Rikenellaceae bacterium]|jgi:hypothetical protein|nr:hypothetical protein [Rikenellaceae bacterium]